MLLTFICKVIFYQGNFQFNYDTLFVAAAIQSDTQVLTYDQKLANKFGHYVLLLE
ncbi:MAG: hypothetical protein ACKO9R_14265 [Dolichospermum sp.]|nr:hypothetical protein [Sphaerospermopsis sp.]